MNNHVSMRSVQDDRGIELCGKQAALGPQLWKKSGDHRITRSSDHLMSLAHPAARKQHLNF